MPIHHFGLPVSDLAASTTFYVHALPINYKIQCEIDGVTVGMGPPLATPDFWISKATDRKSGAAAAVSTTHVCFAAESKGTVRRFYEAALKAGATCNGPPRYRPQYAQGYYAAFVLDLDGNNVEVMYFQNWWIMAIKQAPRILGVVAAGLAWWAGRNGWLMG